ncbi:ROK family transcriptional regulator [Glycomyces sp. TRM65418]|uniref:ROK family protein n=1 Tax=Glycomyces sp. TRM65418 TaxID=2867006 RepID=UPI001CE529D7|nr:ROK family transcriptional regulator [Glycomyces sp. TRM65418]MCC3764482.1 ROK family transcriptional regulator [Glycomyces sp. TRM65418]QZD54155.1 ROK family transcriptional regulator [Glycomyces sp. TRM65418]
MKNQLENIDLEERWERDPAGRPGPRAVVPEPWPSLRSVERSALRELLIHGPKSRAELARLLGMSPSSLTRVTRTLVEQGFVVEGATELRGATGRPSELLNIRPGARNFLGVKLTHDTLFAVVTDLTAQVLTAHQEPLDSQAVGDAVAQLDRVHELLAASHPDIAAVGICLAGDVQNSGGRQIVVESPFLGWSEVALADLVCERVGIPVIAENDVRALTAAEHWFGVGAGYESMALVTVGTGIGVGLVVGGRIVDGAQGKAGRLDHLPIDPGGRRCEHGHRGCLSTYVPNGSIVGALRTPGLDYEAAVELARSGDPAARMVFGEAGHALGVLVATIANAIDPEKFVITGDGIALTELARTELDASIEIHRHHTGAPISIDIQPFEFVEWARAGAVVAIRSCLQF